MSLLASSFLGGCFTGIESTPRITEKDVQRNIVNNRGDDATIELSPEPITLWHDGRRFVVTDSKLSLLFEKNPHIEVADTLVFRYIDEEISITGDTITVISFDTKNGQTGLRYKVNVPISRLTNRVTIPMTVDLELMENVSRTLTGKKVYVLTPLRVDSMMQSIANGRRYIPVKITSVTAGNANYPLCIGITDAAGQRSFVAMTAGEGRSATRNFDKIFTLTDPRTLYPTITDANWDAITRSQVIAGMTLEECRLSLGSPTDLHKWHNGGSYFERWTYDNGAYLIFEDGLLSRFGL